jgi:hypothetical protein
MKFNNWTIQSFNGGLLVSDNDQNLIIDPQNVNDLIVGLLIMNPGDNPTLYGAKHIADFTGKRQRTVIDTMARGTKGLIRVAGQNSMRLLPKEAIPLLEWLPRGNPTLKGKPIQEPPTKGTRVRHSATKTLYTISDIAWSNDLMTFVYSFLENGRSIALSDLMSDYEVS